MIPERREVTNWLLQLLRDGTSRPICDGTVPKGTTHPYGLVLAIPGGGPNQPALQDPDATFDFAYQVDAAGKTRSQADWMIDAVRRTILSRNLLGGWQVDVTPPLGWVVCGRVFDSSGGVEIEGTPPYEVYSSAERYVLTVTPA